MRRIGPHCVGQQDAPRDSWVSDNNRAGLKVVDLVRDLKTQWPNHIVDHVLEFGGNLGVNESFHSRKRLL